MKKYYILLTSFLAGLFLLSSAGVAQQLQGGYAPNYSGQISQKGQLSNVSPAANVVQALFDAEEGSYSTTLYTFDDIIVFSYFDNTDIMILNAAGDTLANESMSVNSHYSLSAESAGVYHVTGSNAFSVIVGDALTNGVQGYFAVDQGGYGTSTLLNTFMMRREYGTERFIVFAYEDGTQFSIRNLGTNEVLHAGLLNADEYFTMPETPFNSLLQVSSNNPVSALSYADTDYYVPSSTGLFSGTEFLGYSGVSGGWTNSITVTGYYDDTEVVVTNLATADTIEVYTLNEGEVRSEPTSSEIYWKVEASEDVTVANIPYEGWTGNYLYLASVSDRDGLRAGELFYVPTIGGQLDIFSFADDNEITITRLGSDTDYPYEDPQVVQKDTLASGETIRENVSSGRHVYKVEGTANLAVIQSYSGFGADFMPLRHSLDLPNLALSSKNITYSKSLSDAEIGEEIEMSISIDNQGNVDAENIEIELYSGQQDETLSNTVESQFKRMAETNSAPLIGRTVINRIAARESGTATIRFTVPESADYRNFSIAVDPKNQITEANVSNNRLSFPLIQNQDLQPPLASHIDARAGLNAGEEEFTIGYRIFNITDSLQANVEVELNLLDGLELIEGDSAISIETFNEDEMQEYTWTVKANSEYPGFNRYQIQIQSDDMDSRLIKRAINVKGNQAPQSPNGFSVVEDGEEGGLQLSWNAGTESDLEGYILHYGTESGEYNGTGADQGDSPVYLSKYQSYNLTGLEDGTEYYFAIQTFNSSDLRSNFSDEITATYISTSINNSTDIPKEYELGQNYPNPFNPSTQIRYSVPEQARVKLEVYNMLGQRVATLVNENKSPGRYEVNFDASGLSSGVYIYRLQAESHTESRQMMLIK